MSTHPPLSSPSLPAPSLPHMLDPAPQHPASPVHLPAPRPVRFASFHGPWPAALQLHAAAQRPGVGRSQSFDPSDRLREAMAALSFDAEQGQQLTPSPSTPPDYLLELLSIFSPPARSPAPIHTSSLPLLPARPSLATHHSLPEPGKAPTPPPRPSAPFRHRRHPSATSLLLDTLPEGERGRKGADQPYWKPTPEVRDARKRRSGPLRRSTSGTSGSGATSPTSASPASPIPDTALLAGFLALTPGGSSPVSPLPLTPSAQGLPTPVSVPADPRVLGLAGFPFPSVVRTPLREECTPELVQPGEILLAPEVGMPPELAMGMGMGGLPHAHAGAQTLEPEELELAMAVESPRAFLLREMREEQEALAMAVAASASASAAAEAETIGEMGEARMDGLDGAPEEPHGLDAL